MVSIFRWIAWLLVVGIALVTLCPISWRPISHAPADVERAFAFFLVGGAVFAAYPKRRLLSVLLVVGWAAALEAGQLLVPSRHARLHDFIVKALAAVIGAAAAAALARFRGSK
jgi:VanZ family protein